MSDSAPRTTTPDPAVGSAESVGRAADTGPAAPWLYPPLDADQRWLACEHEAGHAVAYALGATAVSRVAVAPIGCTGGWGARGQQGAEISDGLGVCNAPVLIAAVVYLRWDRSAGHYAADRGAFRAMLKAHGGRYRRELRRTIRADMVAALAGPAAQQIAAGVAPPSLHEGVPDDRGDDIAKAQGLAQLLPYRREFDHAAALTVQTLREPAVWASVLRLAEALQAAGELEGEALDALLPPRRKAWPPPPHRGPAGRAALAQAAGVSA